jgi:hypothetical protein
MWSPCRIKGKAITSSQNFLLFRATFRGMDPSLRSQAKKKPILLHRRCGIVLWIEQKLYLKTETV